MNQRYRILQYMLKFGSITPAQAFNDLGITKLATRISEMIDEGLPIVKSYETGKNRFGEKTSWMKYRLRGEYNAEQDHKGLDTNG